MCYDVSMNKTQSSLSPPPHKHSRQPNPSPPHTFLPHAPFYNMLVPYDSREWFRVEKKLFISRYVSC